VKLKNGVIPIQCLRFIGRLRPMPSMLAARGASVSTMAATTAALRVRPIACDGILLPESIKYPDIAANGGNQTLRIPIQTSMQLPDARAEITIQIIEPHFKVKIQGKRLVFSTRAFKQPNLKLVRFAVTEQTAVNNNQQIDINEIIDVKFTVQNLGKGAATDVSIQILCQQKGVMLLGLVEGQNLFRKPAHFSSISPGQYRTLTFRYFVNSEFSENSLRFDIQGTEKYQQFGFTAVKTVAVNTTLAPEGRIQQVAFDDQADQGEVVIKDAPELIADIDRSIPKTRMNNPHAVALVIGNRDYKKTDQVQYAINDALSMKRYLTHVMGYAANHVFLIKNASKGSQFASWYTQKQHGLFTYFFLKGIHSKGADINNDNQITLQELFWYVSDRANGVPYYSMKLNHVEQTPTISGKALGQVLVSFDE